MNKLAIKEKRKYIGVPADLFSQILALAKAGRRSIVEQVKIVMELGLNALK